MENLESVQRDLKNKLLGRIDEVHDDVKQLRQIVDTNLEDIANELMAKNSKVSGIKVDNHNNQPVPINPPLHLYLCLRLQVLTFIQCLLSTLCFEITLEFKDYYVDLSNFNAFQKNSYALEELKFSVASSEQKLNKEAINPFN